MMEPIDEADDGFYLKKSGIDRSVGYLIAGVVVLLVFVLILVGMGRIQGMSDDMEVIHTDVREQTTSEIGDANLSGDRD